MHDKTPEERVDWSEVILGEDNEVIGHFTSEDADEYFSDPENEITLD